jgi:uncharacterized protein (UPF0332 family)
MKAFLDKVRALLDSAAAMLRIDLNEDADRAAYLATVHALIFETIGEASRSHGGVQRQFAQLVKDDPRVDRELRTFLPNAYNLKAIADYQIGPGSHVSAETAREAIATVRRFIECVASLIPPNGPAADV